MLRNLVLGAAAGMVTYAASAVSLDPPTQAFVDRITAAGGPPLSSLSPVEARRVLDQLQANGPTGPDADVREMTIPVGPTGSVPLHIVRPMGAGNQVLPVVVYFHGGGWVLGNYATHARLVRTLAAGTGATLVFVDYTPAPEAQYPVQIEQAYAATKYVAEHAAALNVDAARLAVAGDSVGGNMATVVTMLAKERGTPTIRFQALYYPVTDAGMDTASYAAFENGPWLTKASMRWFWDQYLPDVARRAEPKASPLRATTAQLTGLPPALVVTDENDVLRDEGEAYGLKLAAAGVHVTRVRMLGTIHDFVMLNGLATTPAAESAVAQGVEALGAALSQ